MCHYYWDSFEHRYTPVRIMHLGLTFFKINKVKMRRIIVILWKKFAVVWLDAQKCKPDCSFTSFWVCDDSQLLKESPPSEHANVNVPTITEGRVEKKRLHYLFTIMSALSLRYKSSWPTLSRNTVALTHLTAPVTSETTFDDFPYMYTNAGLC